MYEHRQKIPDGDYVGICDKVKGFYDSNEQYHLLKKTLRVEQMDDEYKRCSPANIKHFLKGIVITNICLSNLNKLRVGLEERLGTT